MNVTSLPRGPLGNCETSYSAKCKYLRDLSSHYSAGSILKYSSEIRHLTTEGSVLSRFIVKGMQIQILRTIIKIEFLEKCKPSTDVSHKF